MNSSSGIDSLTPTFAQLLEQRGYTEPEAIQDLLNPSLDKLLDPFMMRGVREACALIQTALNAKQKIMVHGDYDVDGVTGSAIMARTLKLMGADFRVFLPHRAEDGYGVSARAIQEGADQGVKLLITVDCGVAAKEQMELAKELGLKIVIVDHHKIPEEGLPPADAIINPLQDTCEYPFKELSAGGLAFKLSQALIQQRSYAFLDLAAVSTVCDVVPLRKENRVLVSNGLKLLSQRTQLGFAALADVAKLGRKPANVGHIGFAFGPRINAAGRMGSPDMAFQLLMTESAKEAESLAEALDSENKARQKEERQVVKEAIKEVERTMQFNRDRVIVVGREGWHQGVIGIVASRLVEKFYRPAIVIALENGKGKGSGRSIKGFNLYEAMASCAGLLDQFGGHPQAAGLSIQADQLEAFRTKINDYAREQTEADTYVQQVKYDLDLELDALRGPFVRELELLEPHGMGNSRPVFKSVSLTVAKSPNKTSPMYYRFYVSDGQVMYEASVNTKVLDNHATLSQLHPEEIFKKGKVLTLYYSVKRNSWNGQEHITLDVKHVETDGE